MFKTECAGGMVTELTTNIIAEWLLTQCDADKNDYLILNVLVDFCRNNKAIPLSDQQTTVQGRSKAHKTAAENICCQYKDDSTSWE